MTCNRCTGERLIADMEHTCGHAKASVSAEFAGYVGKCLWKKAKIPGVEKELFRIGCKPIVMHRWCFDEFKFCGYCGKEIEKQT